MLKRIAPFGNWDSPITSDVIVAATVGLIEAMTGNDRIYWLEMRPQAQGRYVIVSYYQGQRRDLTGESYNARTRVHEYGGGHFCVGAGQVFFSNFGDQRLYQIKPAGDVVALTPEGMHRYADGEVDSVRRRVVCVRESHDLPEPENNLVAVPFAPESGPIRILARGYDFYASPRLSPSGDALAWVCWNHPNMPWDDTELWMSRFAEDGALAEPQCITQGHGSVQQPLWSPSGELYFIADGSGWWNIYRRRRGETEVVLAMAAEFASPPWVFRANSYAFLDAERIACTYKKDGIGYLAVLHVESGELECIATDYQAISHINALDGRVVFIGAAPTSLPAVVSYDPDSRQTAVIHRSSAHAPASGFLSVAEPIRFPSNTGECHAFYYRPQNAECAAPATDKPPLVVISHGGPTGCCDNSLKYTIQFWTSRGFAVADVNYGGSTGFGRAYRQRLDGNWGIVDVDDCVNAARYLIGKDEVDAEKIVIRGSSAGGYTTLCALTFTAFFKGGASYYGVSDLQALLRDTHKFESRYLDRLVGPYPEAIERYQDRSPINAVDRLTCPVIFFQGLEDTIVPPQQAESMVNALRAKKLPVAYLTFPQEQHGFRQAATIKRCLEAELYFYRRIFNLAGADPDAAVVIENL